MPRYTDYDRLAWIYSRHWCGFSQRVLPVLDRLLLRELPAGARLLDVCCGAGHLAALLTARGFRLTGLDGSEEMIHLARRNAPAADFVVDDARSFLSTASSFDAAVSLFDSLNHMLSLRELTAVFRNVRAALREGGRFVFDLNMEEGYRERWQDSLSIVEEDYVCVVRARYDATRKLGSNDVTIFYLREAEWRRTDLTLTQRCYEEAEVRVALAEAGFTDVSSYEASRDLGVPMGAGRSFFSCRRD